MGDFTNTGNSSHAASAVASARTVAAGCGNPRRASVAWLATLSCTAASAANGGTAVTTPASRSRSGEAESTVTCSWVGNSTS